MTTPTIRVLTALLVKPDTSRYGFELAEMTGLKTGSLYPILRRLTSAGWLESMWEDIDPAVERRPRRKYYRLTGEAQMAAPGHIRRAIGDPQVLFPGFPAPQGVHP